jgi:hypothetical protein
MIGTKTLTDCLRALRKKFELSEDSGLQTRVYF